MDNDRDRMYNWWLCSLSISELESGADISYLPVAQNVETIPRSCAWNGFCIRQFKGLEEKGKTRNRPEMIKTQQGDLARRQGDESWRNPLT